MYIDIFSVKPFLKYSGAGILQFMVAQGVAVGDQDPSKETYIALHLLKLVGKLHTNCIYRYIQDYLNEIRKYRFISFRLFLSISKVTAINYNTCSSRSWHKISPSDSGISVTNSELLSTWLSSYMTVILYILKYHVMLFLNAHVKFCSHEHNSE